MTAFDGGDGFVGEFVAAFVVGVAGVAFDPVPLNFVLGGGEFAETLCMEPAQHANGGKTTYLFAGEDAGSKLDKATKFGVKILTETEFRAML